MCVIVIEMKYLSHIKQIVTACVQGDHLSGKPGNVGEFDSCQGNVRDFTENQESVRGDIVRLKWPKTVYCKLHICIHTCI